MREDLIEILREWYDGYITDVEAYKRFNHILNEHYQPKSFRVRIKSGEYALNVEFENDLDKLHFAMATGATPA